MAQADGPGEGVLHGRGDMYRGNMDPMDLATLLFTEKAHQAKCLPDCTRRVDDEVWCDDSCKIVGQHKTPKAQL